MTDSSEAWRGDDDSAPMPPGIRALFNLMREPTPAERAELQARYATLMEIGNARYPSLAEYQPAARCAKCGHAEVIVTYHFAPDPEHGHPSLCLEHAGAHEHFIRQCRGCGFVWWERTLAGGEPARPRGWWAAFVDVRRRLARRREGARG